MSEYFKIDSKKIGSDNPCFLIAEVAQSHDGSLGQAHAYIDAAAAAGADAVKFQTHIANAESTYDEKFRIKFSQQDQTRYDYWLRMEFSLPQWRDLQEHAKSVGLVFLSSPFSIDAVNLLEELDIPAWKIGSGEFFTANLIDAIICTRKPILLSTGMAKSHEIDFLVNNLNKNFVPFCLMQCTTQYPSKVEEVGLNIIQEFRTKYRCATGLSDHTGLPWPSIAAIAQGCNVVEVHVTFDRMMFGPDVKASVTFQEFKLISDFRNSFYTMQSNEVDKDSIANQMTELRTNFSKSLAPVHPLNAGTILKKEMLTLKKPGSGIPFEQINEVVGKVLARDIDPSCLLKWDDLKGGSNA
jgi:N,N'-diacetyllegionaminate synthase